MSDTIYAPATAAGRAAVAVVRVSGPRTRQAVEALAGRVPAPRQAALRRLRWNGAELDEALTLWFQGPASYTGEDAAEFHVHGGPAVVEAVVGALAGLGLRLAEPGEFTRRAFENGKLDLTQAEGVADLIDAETDAQRRQALGQVGGQLSQRYERWRGMLIEAQAVLEAAVDFPDEDLPADVAARARPALAALAVEIHAALDDVARGRRVRDGYRIALVGAPNAGKSTLLNALAGREAAIVTATPGTTRDIIEVPLILGGYKTLLADTAGVRDTTDAIEAEGVRRARAWAAEADLRLWVVDGAGPVSDDGLFADLERDGDWRVLNKADLGGAASGEGRLESFRLSAKDPAQVAGLRQALEARVQRDLSGSEFPAATRLRHAERLREARGFLSQALTVIDHEVELASEDVRLAARALAKVTGRIDSEDVLDRVFSSFCIGK
ncbi:MAG: tRNA modification GTPase TrmE [Caulobacter sp.]|nr:tRNA modification GTPase TrmE [Caulobacter sp.]